MFVVVFVHPRLFSSFSSPPYLLPPHFLTSLLQLIGHPQGPFEKQSRKKFSFILGLPHPLTHLHSLHHTPHTSLLLFPYSSHDPIDSLIPFIIPNLDFLPLPLPLSSDSINITHPIMDSHANPWSFQQQQQQQTQFLEDDDDDVTATNSPFHSRRSHDRKHYSYASSITLASDSFHDDFFTLRKSTSKTTIVNDVDSSNRDLQHQQHQQSSHGRTWSQGDTITSTSDYGEDDRHHHYNSKSNTVQRQSDNDDVLEALQLADYTLESTLSPSSTDIFPLSLSSSSSSEVTPHTDSAVEMTLADSGIGIEV